MRERRTRLAECYRAALQALAEAVDAYEMGLVSAEEMRQIAHRAESRGIEWWVAANPER